MMGSETDADDADAGIETELRAAIDAENDERAHELAAELWDDREVVDVEVADDGDGGTVEVSKDGLLGLFGVQVDRHGHPRAEELGTVIFERHDDEGYHLVEDAEVMASMSVLDRMNDALEGVVKQYQERRAREQEFQRMVL